tara:strand:- start:250 stop:2211 length:1962 start_codon:yes stop_codon:yes gene_type:complete
LTRKYEKPVYSKPPMLFASDDELVKLKDCIWFYDIELYENFCLIAFKCYETGQIVFIEQSPAVALDKDKLDWMVKNLMLIGFNSMQYDRFILWAILQGKWTEELKAISDAIIIGGMRQKEIEEKFGFRCGDFNHIDLQQVAPAAAQQLSLKHYGARMHCQRLQELPLDPHLAVSENNAAVLRSYCINDLDVTGWLYHRLKDPINLRCDMSKTYNRDLRSLSDAQIAEKAIGSEIKEINGVQPKPPAIPKGETFRFRQLPYLKFFSDELKQLRDQIYNTDFVIDENGKVQVDVDGQLTTATNLWSIRIGGTKYKLGIGGLHSEEKKRSIYTDEKNLIYDRDVASYYPSIILNQELYPHHIGEGFLQVYRDIYERRLSAKEAGDTQTSESLKICINGCFGKLGSKWSIFYSPHLLVQVTLTGQLSLLMLIELLERRGIPVVSANTDGIVILCPRERQSDYLETVAWWEKATDFVTEETPYLSVHSRDVNNYIAICPDGKIKAKGAYVNETSMANPDRQMLMNNPAASICTEAVMRFLETHQKPNPTTIEQTIKGCNDIRQFLFVRRVNGGAVRDKVDLGKVVRWYIRKDDYGAIYYKKANAAGSTNRVPESDGAMPLQELPEKTPSDIDYSWYIRRAHNILKDIGFVTERQLSLF